MSAVKVLRGPGYRHAWAMGALALGLSGDDEELPSGDLPKEGNLEIETKHPQRRLRTLRHGVREEFGDLLLDVEAEHGERLGKGELGEREIVVEEVPVFAGEVLDVGPECDHETAGLEAAESLAHRCLERRLLAQMLEEVAGEDDVE